MTSIWRRGFGWLFNLASIAEVATEMDISKTFIRVAHDLGLIMHTYTLRSLSENEAFVMMTPLLS